MNKETAISKINKAGKIGRIICLVLSIIIAIGAAFTLLAAVFFAVMPKDFLKVDISTNVEASINMDKFFGNLSGEDYSRIQDSIASSGNASINVYGATQADADVTLDNNSVLHVNTDVQTNSFTWARLVPFMFLAVTILIFAYISMFFAMRLFKAFSTCSSPFDEAVIKKMNAFAFSLIPWTVLNSVTSAMASSLATSGASVNISINFTMIFVVLVIFGLSFIFKYGAVLQRESDETL